MYAKILLTITITIEIIDCFYLEAESNYLKPKLERNNIVNKGVWVRNKFQEDMLERSSLGNFIFKTNSLDAESDIQNNFYGLGGNSVQESPFVSTYVQRMRRSPEHIRRRRPRKGMKHGNNIKNSIEDSVMIKSKIVSDLRPTSVFNEYPYEVAILLNNNEIYDQNTKFSKDNSEKDLNVPKAETKPANKTNDIIEEEHEVKPLNLNATIGTDIAKRSKKHDQNNGNMNNYNMVEEYNKTDSATELSKKERNVFHKDNKIWNAPVPDSNIYKVVPKQPEKSNSVTERGLIKVITMLTKTFKKVTKQHSEIKQMHDKLSEIHHNVDSKISELNTKFEDFDSKYTDMIQFNNKIKAIEIQLSSQKEYIESKQKEIENAFEQFQVQQKKFLAQQGQFYGIQKLMLAQNEKINAKQNLIAKTQSEISHRQNNLARILKKTKQIINENKAIVNHTEAKNTVKFTATVDNTVPITTATPPATQAMKINLFSIPTKTNLENQDALIIKEKDDKQIDDLVYKFYFNNTFIDNLMRSKVLNNYAPHVNGVEIVNRSNLSKIKRDELETTLMLPVNNSLGETPVNRERRWINHFSKNKYKKLNRHRKETTTIIESKEAKLKTQSETKHRENNMRNNNDQALDKEHLSRQNKGDPFMKMASNFCNEIGQNVNDQMLKWCVEKALRKLKIMEMNSFTQPTPVTVMKEQKPQVMTEVLRPNDREDKRVEEVSTLKAVTHPPPTILPSEIPQPVTIVTSQPFVTPMLAVTSTQPIFFPDNDELESNLKQYDLKPDTEGNVYYEGSVHISDYGRMLTTDSGGTSDIMPGLMDSNSKVDIDPLTFDLQAKRRAYVRRLNERIMQQMRS